jgi:hypothetical protein
VSRFRDISSGTTSTKVWKIAFKSAFSVLVREKMP